MFRIENEMTKNTGYLTLRYAATPRPLPYSNVKKKINKKFWQKIKSRKKG